MAKSKKLTVRSQDKLKKINEIAKLITEMVPERPELAEFWTLWVMNAKNATKAYLQMRPTVTTESAKVQGSIYLSELTKLNPSLIMSAYGLDADLYLTQLYDGVKADKWNDFTGEREPDHKTRKAYHDKLGIALGIESNQPAVAVQINNVLANDKEKYGL